MAKKDITIKYKSDTKEAQSGIKKVASELNKLSKGIKASDVTALATGFTAVTKAAELGVKAVKKINETIKETTELYRVQAIAEKTLEVAARNNPYLDSGSVMQLKDYAGQLQKVSTVGDEQLLPMMAQLASAGRTQSEIQQIMSAALDVSASGMMSLDSAVTALNKTYAGTSGQLGNQIAELKNLSKEELQSGKAVDIVAQKFKGMAEETAKATGSTEQLKNAMGDYKEEVGAVFEKKLAPMRQFFTELIQGWADAKKAKREYDEAVETNADPAKQTIESLTKEIDGLQEKIDNYYSTLHGLTNLQKLTVVKPVILTQFNIFWAFYNTVKLFMPMIYSRKWFFKLVKPYIAELFFGAFEVVSSKWKIFVKLHRKSPFCLKFYVIF